MIVVENRITGRTFETEEVPALDDVDCIVPVYDEIGEQHWYKASALKRSSYPLGGGVCPSVQQEAEQRA